MLSNIYVEEHVKSALMEDIGFGDVTTESIVGEDKIFNASLVSRCEGIICGLDVFKTVFKLLSDKVKVELLFKDGDKIKININTREITLMVSDEELSERRKHLKPFELKCKSGCLAKYAKNVQDASHGAIV